MEEVFRIYVKEMLTRVIHCYILLMRGGKQCITVYNSLWIKKGKKVTLL